MTARRIQAAEKRVGQMQTGLELVQQSLQKAEGVADAVEVGKRRAIKLLYVAGVLLVVGAVAGVVLVKKRRSRVPEESVQ